MVEVKRISIGSAMKIGAVLSAISGALYALFILLFGSALTGSVSTSSSYYDQSGVSSSQLLLASLCMIPVFGIVGGISAAISAFVYNVAAGWVGGLEIEITDKSWYRARAELGPNGPPQGFSSNRAGYNAPYGSTSSYGAPSADISTTDKLQRASDMIRDKQYKAAYALLKSMPENATAQKWLAKLDEIDPMLSFEVNDKPKNDDWSPIRYD